MAMFPRLLDPLLARKMTLVVKEGNVTSALCQMSLLIPGNQVSD